jgi:cell division protein FtsQ
LAIVSPNKSLMGRENFTRDDEFLSRPRIGGRAAVEEMDDAPRPLDLDPEEESPFLRAQKRVPVRRGPLPRKAVNRLKIAFITLAAFGVLALAASIGYGYASRSWRFRIAGSDNIETSGIENVSRRRVLEVFGADLGRNIFFVPLAARQRQLQQIPWIESATVIRLLPDRLQVQVRERTPVGFVRLGSRVTLIDQNGVVMEMPPGKPHKFSFPVITGLGDAEPLSKRAASMQIYAALVRELDSEGAHYSQDLSEVDLADSEDVKVMVPDPAGAVLVHLGSGDFLRRYKLYLAHAAQWRQEYQKLQSVDLRYDRQIIVNPDARPPAAANQHPGAKPVNRLPIESSSRRGTRRRRAP